MTVREHMALRLAAAHYGHAAVRETHALEHVGLTPTPFWALVNRVLDDPEAERVYPTDVRRLRPAARRTPTATASDRKRVEDRYRQQAQ